MVDDTVLKMEDVWKIFRLGETEVQALRGINLQAKRGEVIAIMGPSGSGKSTILNLVGALDTPTKGKVYVNGKNLSKMSEAALTVLRRREIGFIFQFYNLIPVLTAFENVELPMMIAGISKGKRKTRTREILKMVEMLDRAKHRPDELSGGQQQRVAIARAVASKPSIILADEPTGDLDSKTGKHIMTTLCYLAKKEGVTVIIVTHDIEMAQLADKILEIRDGKIEKEIETYSFSTLEGIMDQTGLSRDKFLDILYRDRFDEEYEAIRDHLSDKKQVSEKDHGDE
ncbi:MAG: ATP-binding cassette domain-containing protein [Nitrososphaeria archaeon]|nr:ATP-binding cassette domain-containing protein [Nitrososphaeria archaeon]NIN52684.1 ATP-binding cassette domain-containing protein [Nitrososphaeria archaeon]NIQ33159.1 ATP-binding cassette domain-containing protein [Nitrososphaeria archaeon]